MFIGDCVESQLWTVKYSPSSLSECAGNDEAREELREWAMRWKAGKPQKPLLLAGPTGCGKTACAHALAREMNWLLVETNASDLRDKENLQRVYGLSSASAGLFGQKRLFLFDEVDGAFDRGEVPELYAIVRTASQPVLLTANDAWNPKLAQLRAACKIVDFKAVNTTGVKKVLREIAGKEKAGVELVDEIASECKGDLRSAINDLQAGFASARERKLNIFNAVGRILKTMSYAEAIKAGEESEVDFDLLSRWLEENIVNEYEKASDVAKAFDALSRADVFSGRKLKRQHHALLKYERALTLAGVALAKQERYQKFARYAFPSYVKQMAAAKAVRQALAEIASKAAKKMHCSKRDAGLSLAFLAHCRGLSDFLELSEEQSALLKSLYGKSK